MMHATSESDITSIEAASSGSPRPYYVQSPSRDSHEDMDKCSSSNDRSLDSPSAPRHSLTSSSSTNATSRISGNNRRRWTTHYCPVVEEESGGFHDYDDYEEKAYARQCSCLILGVTFGLLFSTIWLVVFAAARNFKPQVSITSLKIENLYLGEGSDHTGVPTKLISVNCSANLVIRNPAKLFGIDVTSHTAHLKYLDVKVATGQVKKYYQKRKSTRMKRVELVGREVPLYGAGAALSEGGIEFKLELRIQWRGSDIAKLVKMKHTTAHLSCSPLITPLLTTQVSFHPNSCNYL